MMQRIENLLNIVRGPDTWNAIHRTRVKICGIRSLDIALEASRAGADFLGFVFVPNTKRALDEDVAKEIITGFRKRCFGPHAPKVVGVFADQQVDEVNRIAEKVDLDFVQLSGNEHMQYAARIIRPVIRTVHVRPEASREVTVALLSTLLDRHTRAGHICLIDTHSDSQRGGTGKAFDWSMANHLSGSYGFILAGGLTSGNLQEALKIAPWGVDVSSGVESHGTKDIEKIRSFIQTIRDADWDYRKPRGPLGRFLAIMGGGPIREEAKV